MKLDYAAIFGFDGYVDTIYHVLKGRTGEGEPIRFESKADFARLISGAASSDIELERITQKRGGNAPIAAEALAHLGVDTLCMGMTGSDELFETDCENLTYLPLGEPARTMALEFCDSKLMIADISGFHGFDFEALKAAIGLGTLIELFSNARLVGLVNYCASPNMDKLWRGLRAHVLNAVDKTDKKLYFDLADPSRRTEDELKACIELIGDFSRGYETTLSLNLNEARRVSTALKLGTSTLKECASGIFANTSVDFVLCHSANECHLASKHGIISQTPEFISAPTVLTGAGDTFGAGYCAAWLNGLECERCLQMACETARKYILGVRG